MITSKRLTTLFATCASLTLGGCFVSFVPDYTPLTLTADGDRLIAKGVIDASSPDAFAAAIKQTPDARVLVLQLVPGSADDHANLRLARMVRDAGLSTEIPAGGLVSSGGTDLFLAGVTRQAAPDACIGVHSWSVGFAEDAQQALDFPRDHDEHKRYLSYYAEVGTPAAFYWFTLEAAPAEGMHWMHPDEVNRFAMTTTPVTATSAADNCDGRDQILLNDT